MITSFQIKEERMKEQMKKLNEKLENIANTVGNKITKFNCRGGRLCPPANKQNGITLIALIITIIVMLILVGVTINVALNGNLFEKAKTAATKTEEQAIHDKILVGMDLGDNGKILVKETYSAAKNMLQGEAKTINLVTPATEEEITNSVVFEVVGNNGTYTYTITDNKIIVGEINALDYKYYIGGILPIRLYFNEQNKIMLELGEEYNKDTWGEMYIYTTLTLEDEKKYDVLGWKSNIQNLFALWPQDRSTLVIKSDGRIIYPEEVSSIDMTWINENCLILELAE